MQKKIVSYFKIWLYCIGHQLLINWGIDRCVPRTLAADKFFFSMIIW